MDNLENTGTDPQGGEGATSSQGQSGSYETQTAETADAVSAPETVEAESANPWESDPRFKGKGADEIWKAYQEAEKVKGTLSQKAEVANLIQEKFGLSPQELKQRLEAQAEAERQQQFQNNPVAPLYEKLQSLESKLALQEEEKKLGEFLKDNPAYSPFKDKLMKLAFTAEQDKPYDEIAKEYFGQAIAQGQESAYKKIETKTKTQAAGVSRSEGKRSFTLEDLQQMSSSELEKILPHSEPRNLPY